MNRGAEVKKIFDQLTVVGTEGLNLAMSLKHGFAGIARGVNGHACTAYLTDQTLKGVLRVVNNSWVYTDAHGARIVGGTRGDKVIRGIARIGELLHRSPEALLLDSNEIAEELANKARRVAFEIDWRNTFHSVPLDPVLRQHI